MEMWYNKKVGLVSISLTCLKVKDYMEMLLSRELLPTLGFTFKGDGVTCCSLLWQQGVDPHGGMLCGEMALG